MSDSFYLPEPSIQPPSVPESHSNKQPPAPKSHADQAADAIAKEKLGEGGPILPSPPPHATSQIVQSGTLSDKIARQAQQLQLGKPLKGAEGQSDLVRLKSTQNPVTKLQTEFFVETARIPQGISLEQAQTGVKELLQSAFASQLERLQEKTNQQKDAIRAKYAALEPNDKAPQAELTLSAKDRAEMEALMGIVKPNVSPVHSQKMDMELTMVDNRMKVQKEELVRKFNDFIKPSVNKQLVSSAQVVEQTSKNLRQVLKWNKKDAELVSYLQPLAESIEQLGKSIDLSAVPKQYLKEDLISSLRVQLKNEKNPEERERLSGAIQELQGLKASYLTEEQLPFARDSKLGQVMMRNAREFVSSVDVLVKNGHSPAARQSLEKAAELSHTETQFAFKIGNENKRELLAGKLNQLVLHNPYLVIKTEIDPAGARFADQTETLGIASAWMGEGEPIDRALWIKYQDLRQRISLGEFRGEDVTDLKQQLVQTAIDVMHPTQATDHRSVQMAGIRDIRLMSYDSHIGQTLLYNGDAHDIDYARFLAPGMAVVRQTDDGTMTCATLRGALLDHPANDTQTIPPDIVEQLLSTDMDKVQAELEKNNLLGTQEFFDQAVVRLEEIRVQLAGPSPSRSAIIQERNALKRECFQKVHPRAFEQWKERETRIKEYLSTTPNPTVAGMRDYVFREFAPFFKVLSRFSRGPADSLAFQQIDGAMQYRSLESIIDKAKKDNFASPQELADMEQALAEIKQKSCHPVELSLTMDL